MAIVLENVTFSYFDDAVLRDVDLSLAEERVHLLLGPTGSGKTTLALIMAGLLKPRAGSVAVDGTDPASKRFDRTTVQLAFQFPESQIFEMTVEKEIEFGLRNFGHDPQSRRERCRWALGCVGLTEEVLPRDPNTLSFGERRKVALASVIAIKPRYLILDEPLAGLDWFARRSLVDTIRRLKDEKLATIILTHESDLVGEIGDVVTVVAGKRVSSPVPAAEFLHAVGGPGEEMLPDFIRVLKYLNAAGIQTTGRPRYVEDVARAITTALH